MYKPDPRLPPEEQMLPTHAKRLAKEQGILPSENNYEEMYETGLDGQRDNLQQPSREQQQEQHQAQQHHLSPRAGSPTKSARSSNPQDGTWPLASPKESDPGSPRPGTSGGGGYRITPTIANRPNLPSNPSNPTSTSEKDINTPHNPTPRVPDFDKDEEEPEPRKKKGCMGCVVM
jgi:hypothetical protein